MSDDQGNFEVIVGRVRQQLHKERVQLWNPPFTVDGKSDGVYPQEFLTRYSAILGITSDAVVQALEDLRCHALEKLAAKKIFNQSGIATLKARVTGDRGRKITVQISLQSVGAELKAKLSNDIGVNVDQLKLICNGQVIDEDKTLESQAVKNNNQILVIQLSQSETESRKEEQDKLKMASQVTRTRQAAEALSKRTDGGMSTNDKYYLEIGDQDGKPVTLPYTERKALALAMTLHEKGKCIMKHKNYAEALVYLLEADNEFSHCRAEILNSVDNFAILCLDVVWCYLCLKSINDLPNAEKRLQTCQKCFEKSYGKNLERLTAVRGGTGRELALFVRLHVLQAVCAYHKEQYDLAMSYLNQADLELGKLRVDDDQLTQLVSMGFSVREARLGLRACDGDVTVAVEYITRIKQERKEKQEKEKQDRKRKRIQRKFGKTANGREWVNLSSLEALTNMGFPRQSSAEALRQSNNSVDKAVQILQDHPELLCLPLDTSEDKAIEVSDELVAQILSMGFNIDAVKQALRRFGGNSRRAIEELVASGGVLPSCSSYEEKQSNSRSESDDSEIEKAVEELVPDIKDDQDAYLDLTLEEEASIVAEYKALLTSCGYGSSSST